MAFLPNKKYLKNVFIVFLCCSAAAALAFCLCGKMTLPLCIGYIVGVLSACAEILFFYSAWRAAPDGSRVAMFYIMRVASIVLPIVIALIISRPAALGVIVPHLFTTPVLAVFTAFFKE